MADTSTNLSFLDRLGLKIIALLVFLIVVALFRPTADTMSSVDLSCASPKGTGAGQTTPMIESCFWKIISHAQVNGTGQAARLETLLQKLSPKEILSFDMTYHKVKNRSYRNDLWAVAYIAKGGCSDDCFIYFQSWLISRGQHIFNQLLDDPDSLAGIITSGNRTRTMPPLENEQFAMAAAGVWEKKTGQSPYEKKNSYMSVIQKAVPYATLKGAAFQESEVYLKAHFPKMWKRFGKNPL